MERQYQEERERQFIEREKSQQVIECIGDQPQKPDPNIDPYDNRVVFGDDCCVDIPSVLDCNNMGINVEMIQLPENIATGTGSSKAMYEICGGAPRSRFGQVVRLKKVNTSEQSLHDK